MALSTTDVRGEQSEAVYTRPFITRKPVQARVGPAHAWAHELAKEESVKRTVP